VAFCRTTPNQSLVAVTGRFFLKLCDRQSEPIGDVWGNTSVALPKRTKHLSFCNIFTGETIQAEQREDRVFLNISRVLSRWPVALLFAEDPGSPR